jgi:hypothetical protein
MDARVVRRVTCVVAACVVAGACGGSHFQPSAQPPPTTAAAAVVKARTVVQLAAAKTVAAKTARIALSIGISGIDPTGGNVSAAGSGVVDFATSNAQLRLTTSAPSEPLPLTTEERVVGGAVYVRTSIWLPWTKIDLTKLLGSNLSGVSAQADPVELLAYLAAVSDDVRVVRADSVRGVPTTRYHTTLDMKQALARPNVPPVVRARLRELAPALADAKIPLDAWIDRAGRARRIVLSIKVGDLVSGSGLAGLSPGAVLSIQADLFGFGVPVHVSAPPAGQFVESGALGLGPLAG